MTNKENNNNKNKKRKVYYIVKILGLLMLSIGLVTFRFDYPGYPYVLPLVSFILIGAGVYISFILD